ncbi:MAG: NACHT domain-containing protein, partial [Nannocystaceae bacterium]
MTESPRAVRVFVSYSHETRSQDLKVQALAVELEEAGFSVFCDQTVDPPDSWSKLIEREFRRADVLLCVCTATYSRRVDSGVPGGQGRGVTQEGSMIHNEVYDLKMRTDRFRVLHLEGTTVVVPTTLGGKGTHVLRWPSKRDELYVALRRPTNRRRIVGAFERAFGEDVKALDTWAGAFVALSVDEILDFDDQARRIAYEILRLDEPTRQRDALASLADLVGDEHRGPLEDVAEDLNLGRLRRSAPPEEDTDSEPPSSQIVPKRELDRYLEMIDARYSELRLAGFGMKVRVPIRLDDLYVPLHARIDWTTKRRQVFRSGEDAQGHDGEIALAKAFAVARKRGMRGVVLLGDPGSGKTTHLQQVLLKVVREGAESIGLPAGTVPVFLPLRKLRDLEAGLPDFIQQELHDPLLQTAADFGKRLCGRRRLLFLFDGLDEVANAEDRRRVAKWIEDARRADPTNYYLVSCRFSGYTLDAQLDEGFLELQLRPLSPEQVETFVRNWYRIVEGATNEEEQQARVKAEAGADDLLGTLAQPEMSSRRVLEMTRNPLLLTTICLVHRDSGRLPRQRVLLYEEAVSVLLERWRTETKDGLGVTFPAQEAQHVLQPVAWWMHQEQGRIRATAAQLEEPVSEGLQAIGRPNTTPGAFLETIRDESGLLTGWGVDEFGFMHLV